ncbi:MAG TPA: bifunctional riboflavin kinase/FAD synthetase [Chitinophagaceae bacterium]|nr:bifunctional riboflavin kinase/FAD synthetase [Chitinophagaceae bacterium]
MKVFRDITQLPAFSKAVVTIGTFDGVHTGHQQIIEQLKREAERIGGETVLVTFDPHPRKIVSEKPLQLLSTLPEKIELLEQQGIHHLVVVPFTAAFAAQTAQAYVEDFLLQRFHPHTVIIGYDHRFGNHRSGDFHLLEKYAGLHAFELIEIPVHVIDEAAISSTRIRNALLEGRVEVAAQFLGYDYFFEGVVSAGQQLGRTLGYPTANLSILNPDKLIPGNGVYAVQAQRYSKEGLAKGALADGMMNIGVRPTVDGLHRVIEVNLFDFAEDIYGETLRVQLKKHLRAEQKFNGLDALKAQLAKDKEAALQWLRG